MKMISVKILGAELEANLLNPKVARKFEDGIAKVAETYKNALESGNGLDWLEKDCNAVIGFLDDIFGPGSARKVLGEETDLITCLDAFEEIVELYDKQISPIIIARSEALQEKFGKIAEKLNGGM